MSTIKDLQPKQGFEELVGVITEKGEIREFQKFGKPGKVCSAVIKDDSGQCKFSLWNEQIDQLNIGDKVKVTDGYANEWQGEIQVSAGRNGKIEVVGKEEVEQTSPAPVEEEKKPESPDDSETADEKVVEEDIIE